MMTDGTQAKYRVIAQDVRDRIAHGELAPGDPVPTEAELTARWEVSRMTARAALQALEREGLLSPGRPRTVAHREPLTVHVARTQDYAWAGESPSVGADAWVGDMHRAGREPAQRIEVIVTLATADVAWRLDISAGASVISRRLLREAGGQPHNMITFWFPLNVAAGTVLDYPGSITEGSLPWLEKNYGPLSHTVEITARMPTPGETRMLHIPAGVPVAVVWRASRSDHQVVTVSRATYPADRTLLQLDL